MEEYVELFVPKKEQVKYLLNRKLNGACKMSFFSSDNDSEIEKLKTRTEIIAAALDRVADRHLENINYIKALEKRIERLECVR